MILFWAITRSIRIEAPWKRARPTSKRLAGDSAWKVAAVRREHLDTAKIRTLGRTILVLGKGRAAPLRRRRQILGVPDMRTQATTAFRSVPVKDVQVVRTTLGTWVKAICRALDAAGCDSAALLAEAGFALKSLYGATARCPLSHTERLGRFAFGAPGALASGIGVASHIKPTTFHALSYGMSASSTLKEAFERV